MKRNKQQIKWNLEKALDLYRQGQSINQIASELNISYPTIYNKFKSLGIEIRNKKLVKIDETVFDSIDTEEKAYWLGFIFADGYISLPRRKNGRAAYDFEIALQLLDRLHLVKFGKFMGFLENVKVDSYRCRWAIGNKHLWNTLNSYGCTPRKSLTLKFPDKGIFKSQDLIRHFIRGYFDGDGSISTLETSKSKLIVNLIGTEDMLSNILKQCNISTNLHQYKNHSKNTFYFSLAIQKGTNFLTYLYKNSTIYLERKFKLWYNYCRSLEGSNE